MKRKLSTLEYTVLGFAWLRGPCSTYAIMKELGASESSYHKNRAGTAYSVAKRLTKNGYLTQTVHGDIQLSAKGLNELQHWLKPPIPAADISHSVDLLRLRFFFLGAITQDERLAFIENSIEGLKNFLVRCEALLDENEEIGDYFGLLATANTILETQARIQWLKVVGELVKQPLSSESDWATVVKELLKNSSLGR